MQSAIAGEFTSPEHLYIYQDFYIQTDQLSYEFECEVSEGNWKPVPTKGAITFIFLSNPLICLPDFAIIANIRAILCAYVRRLSLFRIPNLVTAERLQEAQHGRIGTHQG